MFERNPQATPRLFQEREPLIMHVHARRVGGTGWQVLEQFNVRSVLRVDDATVQIRPQRDLPPVADFQITPWLNPAALVGSSIRELATGYYIKTASGPGVWTRQANAINLPATLAESGAPGTFELNIVPTVLNLFQQQIAILHFEPAFANFNRRAIGYRVSANQYNVQFRDPATGLQLDPIDGDGMNIHFFDVQNTQQRALSKIWVDTPGSQQLILQATGQDGQSALFQETDEVIVDVYDRSIVASCPR